VLERYEPGAINTRALPRGARPPVPISDRAPVRVQQRTGEWNAPSWPWLWSREGAPETGWPTPARMVPNPATEHTVTGVPAAWKCFGFIANAAASCAPPIEYDAQGHRVETLSNVVERPWAFLTAHEYWVQAMTAALLFGNFIGLNIDVDPTTGFPRQVMPVHPNDVYMMFIDGMPVYYYAGEAFGWDEVTHVRGHTSPGQLWGVGVIAAFREAWSRIMNVDDYGAGTFASAAENSVIIQVDRPELTEQQANAIQRAWVDRHGSGVRRPAVLPKSMNVQPLSFSPADAQFLETRQLSIAEIAFMFLLDPTDLTTSVGAGGTLTYANREQREIDRLTHAVGPWLRRFEQAWGDLLPGRRSMVFNVERLLRTDTLTRLQATEIALRTGTFTLNDARSVERLPPYGTWADEPFRTRDDVPDVLNPTQTQPEPAAEVV
jgi:HK97 family phage portal protein